MKKKLLFGLIFTGIYALILYGINRIASVDESDRGYLILSKPYYPDEGYGINSIVWNAENEITIHGYPGENMPIIILDTSSRKIKEIGNYLGCETSLSPNQEFIAFYSYSEENILIVKNEYPYKVVHIVDGAPFAITWNDKSNVIYWTTPFGDQYGNDGIKIYSYNLDTQILEYLFDYHENNITYGDGISLSPDGKSLLFNVKMTDTIDKYFWSSDIILADINSGETQKITDSLQIDESYPEWFSDDIITYRKCDMRNHCDDYYLVFYDLTTNCSRTVRNANNYMNPSWSADRSQLAYTSVERYVYIVPVEDILPIDSLHEWICEK